MDISDTTFIKSVSIQYTDTNGKSLDIVCCDLELSYKGTII